MNYYVGTVGTPDWATAALSTINVAHQALLTGAKIIATSLLDLFRDPGLLREAKEEFRNRTKDVKWYNLIPEDRRRPKFEPFPKEHLRELVEAFRKEPKWEGYEPELSDRMKKVGKKILDERS